MTWDGTDYSEPETPPETKVAQVWLQLDLGLAVIAFWTRRSEADASTRR